MLPSMWNGINLAENIQMVALKDAHGGKVYVDLGKALSSEFSIPLKNQN